MASVSIRSPVHAVEIQHINLPSADEEWNPGKPIHSHHVAKKAKGDGAFLTLAPLLSSTTTGARVAPTLAARGQAAIVEAAYRPSSPQ